MPKPFPVAEKGRNRLFSAFAPPKTILYNIYHTAGPLQNGPVGSRSAPHPSAPAAGALPSFRTRKHRKHCLAFSPAARSLSRTGRIFIVKTRRTVCAERFSFLPAAGKLPIAKNAAEPHAPRDSAPAAGKLPIAKNAADLHAEGFSFLPAPASFPLLKTPPNRMRREIQFPSLSNKLPII
ncbi:MAG: hypothetical protein ACLRI7_09240 [Ruthenibacterium lactatiformans]